MPRTETAARFEQIETSTDIAVDITLRILDAVTHTRLCGHVQDHLGSKRFNFRCNRGKVRQQDAVGTETLERGEPGVPRFLEGNVLVVCHAIDTKNFVALSQQSGRKMGVDEASRSCDQIAHCSNYSPSIERERSGSSAALPQYHALTT